MDQTGYFLDSAILMYDFQKFFRGMPYRAHRVKLIGDSGRPSGIQEELGTLEGGSQQ